MKNNILISIIFMGMLSKIFAQAAFQGYTLFTPNLGSGYGGITKLIDNDLNIIQSWNHSFGPASTPYLIQGDEPGLQSALLLYPHRVSNPTMENGGVGGAVHCLTWDNELVWEFVLSNLDYQHHHDIQPLPNGNVLMIAWEKKTASEGYAMGREVIDNPLNQMWSEAIFEIRPNGNGGAEVIWEWHLWDHLVQDYCPTCPNFAAIYEHPELFNINNGNVGTPAGPGSANADWIHINSIDYNIEWDQIVFSSRYQNEIFVIDHSTTTEEAASHSGGNYGKGGDFLYRWGNPQNYDRGIESDRILSAQHSINWIPNGYPGEGNFILFNNYQGGNWGESAVLEFVPPVDSEGNYLIEGIESFGPISYGWSYEGDIFTAMQGGAFRQPNGNTLITDCDSGLLLEVTQTGEIVWEYFEDGFIARAQKYALDYFDNNIDIQGDINGDSILNVLDILVLVNIIMGINDEIPSADINEDGSFNILDVLMLISLILDN